MKIDRHVYSINAIMLHLWKIHFTFATDFNMRIRITSKKLKRSIGQMLSVLLLVLYVAGTSQLELIHSFAHEHEASVSHSNEQEKDPCHRFIYHNDIEPGCNQDSHLIVSDKCQMCDLVCHRDQNLLSNITFQTPEFLQEHFVFYKTNLDSYCAVISSSRAPPTLI